MLQNLLSIIAILILLLAIDDWVWTCLFTVGRSTTSFFSNDSNGLKTATDVNFALECKSDDGLCLSSEELSSETENLLHKFYNQLNEVSALHNCGETLQNPNLKIIDILELVGMDDKFHMDHKVVSNVVKEFFIHPKYGVQIFDGEGRMLEEDFDLARADSLLVRSPAIDHPKCKYHKLKEEIKGFFKETVFSWWTIMIFMTAIAILITYKLVIFKRRKSNDRIESIHNYVNLIIDTVRKLSMTDNREKPINHIRDQFIPINDRAYLASNWNVAVEIVRSHESRIVFTEKEIDGNFMEVVSWVETPLEKYLKSSKIETFIKNEEKLRHQIATLENELQEALDELGYIKGDKSSKIKTFIKNEEKLRHQIKTLENELQDSLGELGYTKVDNLTHLNKIIDNKTRVWIRSKEFKRYLRSTSANHGDNTLFQRHKRAWEELFIERAGGNTFAIKSKSHGSFLMADHPGQKIAWRPKINSWEKWELRHLGGSGWAIFSTNPGRYYLRDNINKNHIAETVNILGSWEKFEIIY